MKVWDEDSRLYNFTLLDHSGPQVPSRLLLPPCPRDVYLTEPGLPGCLNHGQREGRECGGGTPVIWKPKHRLAYILPFHWQILSHVTLFAAAAAKWLQSRPTLCGPIDGSPRGSPVPGILQTRTLEWVAISFSSAWKWKVKVKSLRRIWLLATQWTAAYQAPPSMIFSRQEYWSGVPLPSPLLTTRISKMVSNKVPKKQRIVFSI